MPVYSDETLEEIRARTDIVELISQRVPLKRAGSDFKACCPFHHEKTPSFIVSPSRRTFHCFGCDAKGDVFKFLMLSDGMTFPDAVKTLAERCGVPLESTDDSGSRLRKRLLALHADIAAFYQRCLSTIKEAAKAREYLARRKLGPEAVAQFRIGYAPQMRDVLVKWAGKNGYTLDEMVEAGFLSPPRSDGDSFYDKFRGRLMFPICDQNDHVVAFSGRILDETRKAPKYYNSTETPIFRKSRVLYGLSFAKRAITRDPRRRAIICEGQIDVIRCHACGFQCAVASQGTAFTADHVSLLKSYADCAVMAFDGDGAGIKAAIRTGRLFLAAGMPVEAALLPEGEDPDSFLRDRPASDFQALLDSPLSLVELHVRLAEKGGDTSMDSLSRLTEDIFGTIASASKEVFRSFMLREASDLLKIPFEALEHDFAAFVQSRLGHGARAAQGDPSPASARRAQPEAQREAVHAAGSGGAGNADEASEPEVPAGAPEQPAAPAPRRLRIRETPLLAIADILVKKAATPSSENVELADFASQWLPPYDRDAKACARIVDAAMQDIRGETGALAAISSGGTDEERATLAYLVRRPSPILQAGMPLIECMQDLIFRAWVDFLREYRDSIDGGNEDGARQRLLVSTTLRRLESAPDWAGRSEILAALIG